MSATVVPPSRHDRGRPDDDGHAVNATLALIADELDTADPRQMDQLRAAVDAAHTLHASSEHTPIRLRALALLRTLYAQVGATTPCPLDS